LQLLSESWFKHNRDVKFLIDFFVPSNIQGDTLREALKKMALNTYRQNVLLESELRTYALKRFESGQMPR
jgi:hypothetical protein